MRSMMVLGALFVACLIGLVVGGDVWRTHLHAQPPAIRPQGELIALNTESPLPKEIRAILDQR